MIVKIYSVVKHETIELNMKTRSTHFREADLDKDKVLIHGAISSQAKSCGHLCFVEHVRLGGVQHDLLPRTRTYGEHKLTDVRNPSGPKRVSFKSGCNFQKRFLKDFHQVISERLHKNELKQEKVGVIV